VFPEVEEPDFIGPWEMLFPSSNKSILK